MSVGLVVAADGGEGRVGAASGEHDGKGCERLRIVVGKEEAGIPACARIELIHQVRREEVRVSGDERALRLRGVGVKDGVDGVGVGGLQTGVLLEPVPGTVIRAYGVVNLEDDQILAVLVIHRLGALVGASGAVEEIG